MRTDLWTFLGVAIFLDQRRMIADLIPNALYHQPGLLTYQIAPSDSHLPIIVDLLL